MFKSKKGVYIVLGVFSAIIVATTGWIYMNGKSGGAGQSSTNIAQQTYKEASLSQQITTTTQTTTIQSTTVAETKAGEVVITKEQQANPASIKVQPRVTDVVITESDLKEVAPSEKAIKDWRDVSQNRKYGYTLTIGEVIYLFKNVIKPYTLGVAEEVTYDLKQGYLKVVYKGRQANLEYQRKRLADWVQYDLPFLINNSQFVNLDWIGKKDAFIFEVISDQ